VGMGDGKGTAIWCLQSLSCTWDIWLKGLRRIASSCSHPVTNNLALNDDLDDSEPRSRISHRTLYSIDGA
jgi:hypothetical protein